MCAERHFSCAERLSGRLPTVLLVALASPIERLTLNHSRLPTSSGSKRHRGDHARHQSAVLAFLDLNQACARQSLGSEDDI
jgi:hypothetical protein